MQPLARVITTTVAVAILTAGTTLVVASGQTRRNAVSGVGGVSDYVTAAPPGANPRPAASGAQGSIEEENQAFISAIRKGIEGREKEPAEIVFKNVTIPWLGKTEAGTFLSIMRGGYAKALGVRCTYCHVEADFASDAKRPKRAAREMAVMHRMINTELAKMQHIPTAENENRAINCATCHRGAAVPSVR